MGKPNVATRQKHAAILDLDGTLVDTNYHHALAWHRTLRECGVLVPLWRLHRHVGMGGDKFVAATAGTEVEERLGDKVRARWEEIFNEFLPEVDPTPGARELIVTLKQRGHPVVFATSAIQSHFDVFVDEKLDARGLADGWVTKDDTEASKPDPDLVEAALEKLGTRTAVLVGDTPWDCEAARKAGIETICLLTGGFAEAELTDAGAISIFESPRDLCNRLAETPFA
jgi:HAD superfamily hydrolase (TIGR01509 family)